MKTLINGKEHEIRYIDYNSRTPHTVFTIDEEGHSFSWDFFANNGDNTDIRYYNAGSGYRIDEKIPAPNWVVGMEQKYWLGKGVKLKGKSNGIKIETPLRIKGYFNTSSVDPFKVGEETHSREYCEECGHESTEFCYKHKYEDSEGNERWIENDEYSG